VITLDPTPEGEAHVMGGGRVENDENGLKSSRLPRGRGIRGVRLTVSGSPESPLQMLLLNVTGLKLGSWMDGYVPPAEVEMTEACELTRGMVRTLKPEAMLDSDDWRRVLE